jgi:hypothetical protein
MEAKDSRYGIETKRPKPRSRIGANSGETLNSVGRLVTHARPPQLVGRVSRRGPELWNSWGPSDSAFASRLAPPVLKRRAALFGTVDFAAAELADGRSAADSVLPNAHIDHLNSLTETQASGDPRLQSCWTPFCEGVFASPKMANPAVSEFEPCGREPLLRQRNGSGLAGI